MLKLIIKTNNGGIVLHDKKEWIDNLVKKIMVKKEGDFNFIQISYIDTCIDTCYIININNITICRVESSTSKKSFAEIID
jgi:hypothetical protein